MMGDLLKVSAISFDYNCGKYFVENRQELKLDNRLIAQP